MSLYERWEMSTKCRRFATLVVRIAGASGSELLIRPLSRAPGQEAFGAEVLNLALDGGMPSAEVLARLVEALSTHGLLVLRAAALEHVPPQSFAAFVHHFNPGTTTVWRDQRTNPWERYKAEAMGPAGTFQVPSCPETLVIGKGELVDHWGLTCTLGGKRAAYGKKSGSQVIGGGKLQWHIDGAFWAAPGSTATGLPCPVVGMRCVEAPPARMVNIAYGDGVSLNCPAGSTVFCSGARAYDLLSPTEQERARRTTVVYSPHPFKRFAKLGMSGDGLRCEGDDALETALAPHERHGRLRLPLVWFHPRTGRAALMPHTRCLERLEVWSSVERAAAAAEVGTAADADAAAAASAASVAAASAASANAAGAEGAVSGAVSDAEVIDLPAARTYLHTLMRRAAEPSLVHAVDWRPGDCAIWDNHLLWHSATGGLPDDARRVMHLVAFDGMRPPLARPPAGMEPPHPPPPPPNTAPRRSIGIGARGSAQARRRSERFSSASRSLHLDKERRDERPPHVLGLIIGQTPRDDLVLPLRRSLDLACLKCAPLRAWLPTGGLECDVRGAMDGVSEADLARLYGVVRRAPPEAEAAEAPTADAAPSWAAEDAPSWAAEAAEAPTAGGAASAERAAAPASSRVSSSTLGSSSTSGSSCPMITRLASGEPVVASEDCLTPLLQRQLDIAAEAGVGAGRPDHAFLLCAGRFDGLHAPDGISLIKPFECAAAIALTLGVTDAVLCVPTDEQAPHAIARWRSRLSPAATLRTCTLPEDPGEGALACVVDAAKGLRPGAAVILDFVGHPPEVAATLRQRLRESRPVAAATTTVIDVGEAGLAQLRAALMTQAGA